MDKLMNSKITKLPLLFRFVRPSLLRTLAFLFVFGQPLKISFAACVCVCEPLLLMHPFIDYIHHLSSIYIAPRSFIWRPHMLRFFICYTPLKPPPLLLLLPLFLPPLTTNPIILSSTYTRKFLIFNPSLRLSHFHSPLPHSSSFSSPNHFMSYMYIWLFKTRN